MRYNIMCTFLMSIVFLAGFSLPVFIFADSTFILDRKVDELRDNLELNYFSFENMALFTLFENDIPTKKLKSSIGFYPIQIQSPPGSPSINQDSNTTVPLGNAVTDSGTGLGQENGRLGSSTSEGGQIVPKSDVIECEGMALCVTGEVVKVVNAKTFYVNVQNKVHKVELSMISLPVNNEQAMQYSTIFTRDNCLGNTVLIDQDDGQQQNAFIAQVYCSPTKNLNSLLLDTGYVLLDKSQCEASEFATLSWAKSHGC